MEVAAEYPATEKESFRLFTAQELERIFLNVGNGEYVWVKIDEEVYRFKPKEDYNVYVLKSQGVGKHYVAVAYKKVQIRTRKGIDEADACERFIGTPDKKLYVEFIQKYGHFEKETNKS